MKKILLLTWLVFSLFSYSQNVTYQSNPNLSFNDFLKGVNCATLILEEKEQKEVDELAYRNPHIYFAFASYLEAIGFDYVFLTSEEKNDMPDLPSNCQIAYIEIYYAISPGIQISDVGIRFITCRGDYFDLDSPDKVRSNANDLLKDISEIWHSLLDEKPAFIEYYSLKAPSEMTEWNETTIKKYLDNNRISKLEGIYESIAPPEEKDYRRPKLIIGIISNTTNGFDVIYLNGASFYKDWQEGEKKGEINPTANPNLYTSKWKMATKSENNNLYATMDENGLLKMFMPNDPENTGISFLKIYPFANNIVLSRKKGTATAFAITQDGYLVTSQHVVDGSSNLKVVMNNNTGQTSYDVSLVLEDKNNDLAVLKINDPNFHRLNSIPFTIRSSSAEVGEDVFVLGYPLSTTMGNELKATDGIISSKTGFQGDLTSYQVSAPVQPGNSGGPLFDKKGNLIGIISAKHLAAENVSYAVKSSYLINVINALENPPSLPTKNLLSGKSLPDQIKLLKDYVFMIEVY